MSQPKPLARIAPQAPPPPAPTAARLTRKQKAAIIVRFLINEGAEVSLSELPDALQATLTTQMGSMRYVDRATLIGVVNEFAAELEGMGLTFPHGMAGALTALDGRISPQTASRLRKEAGVRQFGDPWEQVRAADLDDLVPIVMAESTEVAAVMLSKLDVTRAADLLSRLPGDRARRVTFAISQTGGVTPAAVDRIGLSLAAQLNDIPQAAFEDGPANRIGAILNSTPSALRDAVLDGLDADDQDFAAEVRRTIFTFANVPARVNPVDIPKVTREVDAAVLVTALAAASAGDLGHVTEFILENMSRRMADALREEMEELGRVKPKDGEEAMTQVVNAVRRLAASGEVTLVEPDEEGSEEA
ncbi:flagellar motor switch protein FliG [Pelagivirga sediminicola]|uniref:Flagellar motor switch protein FliG n=1 Tax=Pelagivirga sediminicola TaxID=2170575 RepID=A0A2T7G5V2_9RHOB|nr:FliG C-terminal domain-containing protein [Pelagivirga sediminicola]PVA09802.1 flagellar motor switch protein FliG [Pelagivirga sediminicola]